MGMWEIIFDGVASPDAFKEKLEKCVFFKKCDEPKAAVIDDRKVTLSFSSPVSRNDLLKKCTQTFSKYGSFTSHAVADKSAPAVSTGSSSEGALGQVVGEPGAGVRAPAAEGTLALRSGVEEIKRAGAFRNRVSLLGSSLRSPVPFVIARGHSVQCRDEASQPEELGSPGFRAARRYMEPPLDRLHQQARGPSLQSLRVQLRLQGAFGMHPDLRQMRQILLRPLPACAAG